MRVLRVTGRVFSALLLTIAKTIGGMHGSRTFDHDNATSIYRRREDYRP
ncbi:hypothetical protein [Frondihabitans australicus]|uniref:Uncharacterized protein n=1 Tax=Frondihabitans australicus TaxID=386892 RepID=A0A495IDY6_9MICO|nr:hypothetical protein [Frondihabitans australicus]RKR74202.1 hypothetical protein C8E83_1310 [Frondihabitans australicus]